MAIDPDTVRILIGDTDSSNQILTDDQLTTLIALYNDTFNAAAGCADAIAALYSGGTSVSISGLISVEQQQKAIAYRALATRLRMQATQSQSMGAPIVTGISQGDMDSVDSDTDRDPNRFKVGMSDFPGVQVAESNDTDPQLEQ
jgi:hypothetical protein